MEEMKLNEYLPLRDVVYETLRQKILKGELKPGDRLIEVELSSALGVSRTPVREAIQKLEQEGLVTMAPRRGARIANISEKNVRDVLEIRKNLECFAVCLAIERITPQEKVRLREAEEAFAKVSRTQQLRDIASCDEAFHEVIYQATKNEKLVLLISNLREQMYRFRFEYIKDESKRESLRREHHEITQAIMHGDEEKARDALSIHIEKQVEGILSRLRSDR